jgi:hypothetical protein
MPDASPAWNRPPPRRAGAGDASGALTRGPPNGESTHPVLDLRWTLLATSVSDAEVLLAAAASRIAPVAYVASSAWPIVCGAS